jgi:hypothetical protein
MWSYDQIKNKIVELTGRAGKNSISKTDVFGVMTEMVNRQQAAELNMSNLTIRKIYASVAAMNADVAAPIGDDGEKIRPGQLVSIQNEADSTEMGKVYRYTGSAWEYVCKIGDLSQKADKSAVEKIFKTLDSSQISNRYNVTGYYTTSGTVSTDPYNRHTPLFKIGIGQKIDYSLYGPTGVALIAAFDKDLAYVSANSLLADGTTKTGTWEATAGTCFVGFSAQSDAKMSLYALPDNLITSAKLTANLRKSLFEIMDSSQIGSAYNTVGYYNPSGVIVTGFMRLTPLFKIGIGQKVDYTLLGQSGALSVIAAFDKDLNYISENSLIGTGATQTGTWTAGATTCYVGFCANNDSLMTISGLRNVLLPDNSITPAKLTANLRKSLFEIMDSSQIGSAYNTVGYYNPSGVIVTGFMRLTPLFKIGIGQKVDYTLLGQSGALSVIAAFDKDLNYISENSLIGTGATQTGTWTAGATTCYVGFCANNDSLMTISGLRNVLLPDNSITPAKLTANLRKSLFEIMDSSQIGSAYNTEGYYFFSNGTIAPTYQRHTPLFKVATGQIINYILAGVAGMGLIAAFDKDLNYISANSLNGTGATQTGTWTAGATTCFVGFSSTSDALMVLNKSAKEADIILPSIVPICIGLELNIYNNSLRAITDNKEKYTRVRMIATTAQQAMQKSDRFNFYHATTLGDYTATAYQETLTGDVIDSKSFTIKCIDKKILMTKSRLNILPIGDSIMEMGYYMRAIQDNFKIAQTAGGSDIRFIGNKTHNPQPDINSLGNIYDEGHSGWATPHFVANGRHIGDSMDGDNPLWNAAYPGGADIDFVNYISNLNLLSRYVSDPIDTIDAFMIVLGTNDPGYCTLSQYIANINTLISKLWRNYPDAIVLISSIFPMGIDSISKTTRITWNAELITQFETVIQNSTGHGRVYYCPAHYSMDRVIGYNITGKSRIPGEYTYQSDGNNYNLHPSLIGGLQFGDALFSAIQYALQRHKTYLDSI